jgi:hypothetical protein
MKRHMQWIGCLLFLGCSVSARADRVLQTAQREQLLTTLTGSPRQYWIESGRVKARHLEYQREEDLFAQSEETVTLDKGRYRWEITIDTEQAAGEETPAVREVGRKAAPDKTINQKRIFCWDGQRYTRYYPKAEYAVVSSDTQEASPGLLGPLSAGIVPWGYGDWQIETLRSRQVSASEITQNGQTLIRLETINASISPALHNMLLLDPAKEYAVLSFVMENDAAAIETVYSDYLQTGGQWIPRKIRTERYLKSSQGRELISYEDWEFTEISVQTPPADRLGIPLRNGTLVEMRPGGGRKSFLYYASDRADIGGILEEKLSLQGGSDEVRQNCAKAAVNLMAKRFSRPAAKEKAASLASEETGQTSLYEVKRSLEEAGLYCLAVRTDLDRLYSLSDYAVIAHLPNLGHFVIVDRIEEDAVWTIDLTSRKFYWKWKKADFAADWSDGTALLVSDSPTRLPSGLQSLTPAQLYEITGGNYDTYSCTEKIQSEDFIPCPPPRGGFLCGGVCYVFHERYGCIEDEFGGTCIGVPMNGYDYTRCKNHPWIEGGCTDSGWLIGLIRACN